jgi:hypothetical protein
MKNINDFMQDKDILAMPEYLREIHCARRLLIDEIDGMGEDEDAECLKVKTLNLFDELGLPHPKIVNMAGKGELVQNYKN